MKTASTSAELIAGLVRKHVEGAALAIDHPLRPSARHRRALPDRIAASCSPTSAGAPTIPAIPFHVVAVTGDDGQMVVIHGEDHLQGRCSIVYEVRPDLRSDDSGDAARWRDWLASDDGKDYGGRARGLQHARSLERSARL